MTQRSYGQIDQVSHKKLLTARQTSGVTGYSINTLAMWRGSRRKLKKLPAEKRALSREQKGPRYIKVKKGRRMVVAYRMSDLIAWIEIQHIRKIRRSLESLDRVLKRQVAALDSMRLRQTSSCDEAFVRLEKITRTLVPPGDVRYPDTIDWISRNTHEINE